MRNPRAYRHDMITTNNKASQKQKYEGEQLSSIKNDNKDNDDEEEDDENNNGIALY